MKPGALRGCAKECIAKLPYKQATTQVVDAATGAVLRTTMAGSSDKIDR